MHRTPTLVTHVFSCSIRPNTAGAESLLFVIQSPSYLDKSPFTRLQKPPGPPTLRLPLSARTCSESIRCRSPVNPCGPEARETGAPMGKGGSIYI